MASPASCRPWAAMPPRNPPCSPACRPSRTGSQRWAQAAREWDSRLSGCKGTRELGYHGVRVPGNLATMALGNWDAVAGCWVPGQWGTRAMGYQASGVLGARAPGGKGGGLLSCWGAMVPGYWCARLLGCRVLGCSDAGVPEDGAVRVPWSRGTRCHHATVLGQKGSGVLGTGVPGSWGVGMP